MGIQLGLRAQWQTSVARWNGRSWAVGTLPAPAVTASGVAIEVTAAVAAGPDDIWAGGYAAAEAVPANGDWSVAESPRSAWVVGEVPLPGHQGGFQGTGDGAGAAYWNGSRWTIAAIGALYPQWASPYLLTNAVSDGSGGLWAVSQVPGGDSPPTGLRHYAHARWTRVSLPVLGPDLVSSMAAAPGTGAAWVAAYSQRPGATPGQIFSNGGVRG
jgi:hypothetical protein